jgi:F0F1-type ATP synthase assembly protein I
MGTSRRRDLAGDPMTYTVSEAIKTVITAVLMVLISAAIMAPFIACFWLLS